jgi:hypothetical protein
MMRIFTIALIAVLGIGIIAGCGPDEVKQQQETLKKEEANRGDRTADKN